MKQLLALSLVSSLVACAAFLGTGPHVPTAYQGTVKVTVANASDAEMCIFGLMAGNDQGENWLGDKSKAETVLPGRAAQLRRQTGQLPRGRRLVPGARPRWVVFRRALSCGGRHRAQRDGGDHRPGTDRDRAQGDGPGRRCPAHHASKLLQRNGRSELGGIGRSRRGARGRGSAELFIFNSAIEPDPHQFEQELPSERRNLRAELRVLQ